VCRTTTSWSTIRSSSRRPGGSPCLTGVDCPARRSLAPRKWAGSASPWTIGQSGRKRYQRTGRAEDSWEVDLRAVGFQTMQPAYKAPFHRGHLVMRLDPLWGRDAIAERAEADTFHWTNCAPRHRRLNNPWWLSVERHILETARVTRLRGHADQGARLSGAGHEAAGADGAVMGTPSTESGRPGLS
jgi:hypothetical protein